MPIPLSSLSWFCSTRVTGIPTFAKFIAIPPPIVPAPIIPTFLISNNSVSFGISGIFATCLWAKKKYL